MATHNINFGNSGPNIYGMKFQDIASPAENKHAQEATGFKKEEVEQRIARFQARHLGSAASRAITKELAA